MRFHINWWPILLRPSCYCCCCCCCLWLTFMYVICILLSLDMIVILKCNFYLGLFFYVSKSLIWIWMRENTNGQRKFISKKLIQIQMKDTQQHFESNFKWRKKNETFDGNGILVYLNRHCRQSNWNDDRARTHWIERFFLLISFSFALCVRKCIKCETFDFIELYGVLSFTFLFFFNYQLFNSMLSRARARWFIHVKKATCLAIMIEICFFVCKNAVAFYFVVARSSRQNLLAMFPA